jgi:hypothetical protein
MTSVKWETRSKDVRHVMSTDNAAFKLTIWWRGNKTKAVCLSLLILFATSLTGFLIAGQKAASAAAWHNKDAYQLETNANISVALAKSRASVSALRNELDAANRQAVPPTTVPPTTVPPTTLPATHTITGVVDAFEPTGPPLGQGCYGTMPGPTGYVQDADEPVKVSGPTGSVLGGGLMSAGVGKSVPTVGVACVVTFSIPAVPDASFYLFSFPQGPADVPVTVAWMDQHNWTVTFRIVSGLSPLSQNPPSS